jgi:predicted dehydrogenase
MGRAELSVALVGTGMMGRLHSLAYATLPSFFPDLPALRRKVVVDVTEDLARRGVQHFGYEEAATDWKATIDRPDIDIVDIVTPNDSHQPIAEYAMARGKHVICEKPLALTADEAHAMATQSRRAKGTHMVGFNYRRCPAVLEAKKLIDEGAIGEIHSFRGLYLQDWAMPDGTPWSWRFGRKEAGSGALGDIGSHALDYAVFLVGEVESVSCAAKTVVGSRPRTSATSFAAASQRGEPATPRVGSNEMIPVDVDDVAIAMMRFRNGALGTLEASRFAWGHKNDLSFEISGSKGALSFRWERRNELHYYSAVDRADVQGYRTIMCGPAQPGGELFWPIPGLGTAYYETQVLQAGTFLEAIVKGEQPDTDFGHGYRIQEVMETMLAAAGQGRWLPVAYRL